MTNKNRFVVASPVEFTRRRPHASFRRLPIYAVCLALLGCFTRSRDDAYAFIDVARESGLDFVHENGARGDRRMTETVIGGLAWLDFDRDGWPDLYCVNGQKPGGPSPEVTNRLYRNLGDGRFADVTAKAGGGDTGLGNGATVGDIDNDGWPDLFVANYGRDTLYRNERGRLVDITEASGVGGTGWSSSAAFLDYDGDGFLDLYVCRYVDYDASKTCRRQGKPAYCSPKEFSGLPDRLFRNLGDGTFEDVSEAAGVAVAGLHDGKSLGVVVWDYDDDGHQDLYVACDQVRNLLFRNRGDGSGFQEVGLRANVAYSAEGQSQAGMGVDCGDVDLDGDFDFIVTNFEDERNALYLADGDGFFVERSTAFGLGGASLVPLGFGVLLFDYDLDGDLDAFVANGHVQDLAGEFRAGRRFAQPDQLFDNKSGRRFDERQGWLTPRDDGPFVSRAAALADYDGDGDEDIAVLHSGARLGLLRNVAAGGAWIAFDLQLGTAEISRPALGARLTLEGRRNGESFRRVADCRVARSYASASSSRLVFGWGKGELTDLRATVRWPGGRTETYPNSADSGFEVGRVHRLFAPH